MDKHPDKLVLISTLGERENAQPYWYWSSVSESCFGDILISESDDSKRMDAWLLRLSLSRHSLFQLSASDKNASCSWFQNTVILILNS